MRANVGIDFKLALHAIDDDLKVQLAHPADNRLTAFLVGRNAERRILLREPRQRHAHLFLIAGGLRLDSDLGDRVRKFHALHYDGMRGITERILS